MNVISKRKSSYTQVANTFLRDDKISFKAKGLFCYMFSMSEGWNFTIKSIATQQKDGQDSIHSALDELKQYRYVTYEKHSDGRGTYHLDDEPKTENPNQENPSMGKSTPIKKEQLAKNKNNTDDSILNSFIETVRPSNEFIEIAKWFIKYRKTIKKPIKTISPLVNLRIELNKCLQAKYTVNEVIELIQFKEWQSIKLEWVQKEIVKAKEWIE